MQKKEKGFTLIELIIVIAVIGIISVVSLSFINPFVQFQKANDAKRKSDLSQIQKVLEQYYQDMGRYPPNPGACPSNDYRIVKQDGTTVGWNESWTPYINILPKDPGSRSYAYVVGGPIDQQGCPNGQAYYLYASLEREANDPQVCNPNASKCDNAPLSGNPCGSGVCNYGVSSPNVSP
ncbi:prepilin-type N-terminal cleavage/methylation domain-containing protein [Candidatus Microgenomates bacterium]|nr:MAG: prepilin-type N-terminal cleavage/methylation domain-containing protein [Candidatus Microgenomates bacterium]